MKAPCCIVLLLFPLFLFGQGRNCGFEEWIEEIKITQPDLWKSYSSHQEDIRKRIASGTRLNCDQGTILVPVAVHFNGSVNNSNLNCIHDVINDQLEVLNQDYGGYNNDINDFCEIANACSNHYSPNDIATETCVQFCLATENHPSGSGLSNGDKAITFGEYTFDTGAAGWEGYLNFFISDEFPSGYNNILGLAPLGGGSNPNGNGVFIHVPAFGGNTYSCISGVALNSSSIYNLGRTGTHEVGHYMGLSHVFSGCSDGDNIADTPNQSIENYGAPSVNLSDCTSTSNNSCSTSDYFFNYMDYVNDNSMFMFTDDQSAVIYENAKDGANHISNPWKTSAINCSNNYTPLLPLGCTQTEPPVSNFTTATNDFSFCHYDANIEFEDISSNFPTGWDWTFSGSGVSPISSSESNPIVTVTESGTLTVSLTASNSAGSDLTPHTIQYNIIILGDDVCADCGDIFTDSGGTSSNYGNNEMTTYSFCGGEDQFVVMEIDEYDIQYTNTTCNDVLLAFDGNSVPSDPFAADNIGFLCGNNAQFGPKTFVASGSCISFLFASDGSVTGAGWEGNVVCKDIGSIICGNSFVDSGGLSNNYSNSEVSDYLICADSPEEIMSIEFTQVEIETDVPNGGVNNTGCWDYLTIYDGDSPVAPVVGVYCGETGLSPTSANHLEVGDIFEPSNTNATNCLYFRFLSDATVVKQGWEAMVTCCLPSSLPEGVSGANDLPFPTNNGQAFNYEIDNSCVSLASTWEDATDFLKKDEAETRSCNPGPNLLNQVLAAFDTGNNSGEISVDISPGSNGGLVDMAIFGPVSGTHPNYSGGSLVACSSGADPSEISIVVGEGETYFIIVASENGGQFTLTGTGALGTLALEEERVDCGMENDKPFIQFETSRADVVYLEIESKDYEGFVEIIAREDGILNEEGYFKLYIDNYVVEDKLFRILAHYQDGSIKETEYCQFISSLEKIKILPNPASTELRIEFYNSDLIVNGKVELVNTMGQRVIEKKVNHKEMSLDTSDLPSGVYYILISNSRQNRLYPISILN